MKLNRREFLRQGGLLAACAALPEAVKVGVETAKEHVLQVYHKHVSVPVDACIFERRTGIPFLDLMLAADRYTVHRLACTCEYTMDGKCAKPCDEASGLIDQYAGYAADLFTCIAQHVDEAGMEDIKAAWREYERAQSEYRRHYCTGWMQGQESDVDGDEETRLRECLIGTWRSIVEDKREG